MLRIPFPARSLFLASLPLALAHAQTAPLPTAAPPAASPSVPAAKESVQHLDKFVVSAGHDPKTAFDVAQGTSVLAGEELHRLVQSTLGDTLASTPGVSSTYYGPGASRPVIRGLGGDRVRVLDNGVGALDASSVSPDHNTAVEPLFASRIEVLRGPSTLLYGSSAIGGAVNVIDNTIPETAGDGAAHGALELRGGGATRERTGLVSLESGTTRFAGHLNLMKQRTSDARISGVARIDADAPLDQPVGTLPGSASNTQTASVGGAYFWSAGRAGAAISRYETDYGVPTGDEPPTSIHMRRTRVDLEGEVTQPFGFFRSAKSRFGLGRYRHSELSGSAVGTTFTNDAWEGRLELAHAPVGPVSGTVGVQASRSDFAARGDEVATPPSVTTSGAVFALEEMTLGAMTTLQVGGRYEGQSITLGNVAADLPAIAGYSARSGRKRLGEAASGSIGVVIKPAKDWAIAGALAYSERVPTAQELFSNGPHGGTAAYEIGSSRLGNERSLGFDVSVRRRAGFVTGSVGAFLNRFTNYIFEQELPANAVPARFNPEGLTPFQFTARDARFVGGEAELEFHLLETEHQRVHLELSTDRVRAIQTASREPLPRIPPYRYGGRLSFEDGRWNAVLEVRHAASQGRIAASETPTGSSTLVNASVGYLIPARRVSYELFVRGRNLTNEAAREHSSFLKEFAPLPGRGVLGGVRLTF